MSVILEIRRRGRHVVGAILGALLFAYFIFHAVQGDRGFLAWVQLKQQIRHASAELMASEAVRQGWEKRIALLRSDQLDRDMLEERVRLITGLGRPEELVIYTAAPDRSR